nr:hypothetical protein [Tanacetum cinerariifolium]
MNLLNEECLNYVYGDGKPLTCNECGDECGGVLRGGFYFPCNLKAENSYNCYQNAYSFNDTSYNPNYLPQPQYENYLCNLCGNNSHDGYDCQQQFPYVYEQEPSYNQNYNDNYYPYDLPSFPCCDNCGGSHETSSVNRWPKILIFPYSKPENPNELFQKLLEDLKELAEYENSPSRDHPIFLNDDENHPDQNKESLENSSKEIATSNSNEKKEEPPQDFDIRQLIREECCVEVCEEQKQNMEDTILELVKICRQKELLCMHDNVDDLIESALNSKLISINSQDKTEQEVKNVVEQPVECGNRSIESLKNFRVIRKISTFLKDMSQIYSVHAIAPILSIKEPEHSLSMEYEHLNTTPETEVTKSSVKNLLPIPSECEEQEVKNVVEQPSERENRNIQSLQNFRVVYKNSISSNTSQISSIHVIAPVLSTKEPEHLLSMGYEHLSITPETESDEVTESNAKNLLPIPSECEVALENKRECDLPISENSPVCDNSDTFSDSKIDDDISVYDDDFEDIEYVEASLSNPEIVSVEEENVVQQEEEEVDLEVISQIQDVVLYEKLLSITRLIANIESLNDNSTPDRVFNSFKSDNSLLDNFSPEFETFCDHSEETRSGNTTHADNSLPEYDSFCFEIKPDQERLINLVKNNISDDSSNDSLLEEADLFLAADSSIPPGIENIADDPEEDIRFLEELLIDDSNLSHELSDSNFEDNPSIPRPPPEPPDVETDAGEEIPVVMNEKDEDVDYSSFIIVIFDKVFSLLSTE